jgi:hypothetical protein
MKSWMSAAGVVVVLTSLLATQPAVAAPYQYRLNGGVSGRNYWIDPNAVNFSVYEPYIVDAVASWNSTPTPVSYSRTYSYCCTSVADFYAKNYYQDWSGVTAFFHSDGSLAMPSLGSPPTSNYDYAEVSLDNPDLIGESDWRRVRSVVAHEFGHALGLDHVDPYDPSNYVACALMNPDALTSWWSTCHTYAPKQNDIDSAKQL